MGMLKWIDLPPVWLLGFIGAAWLVRPDTDFVPLATTGTIVFWIGIAFILWAVVTMSMAKTTVVPHMRAARLVTNGPFRISRNPIYLGDAFVLSGLLLRWDMAWYLPVVILFAWIISVRFIRPEEARLTEDFGEEFQNWCLKTRRWL